MNNNQAASLPATIGNLKKLKRLNLLSTAIREFPDSLRFTVLERINGSLSQSPKDEFGVLPEAKQELVKWFPRAKVSIW